MMSGMSSVQKPTPYFNECNSKHKKISLKFSVRKKSQSDYLARQKTTSKI